MAKQTTSVRLSEATLKKLNELTNLFRESSGEVVERAIDLLHKNSESVAKEDLDKRLQQLKEGK